MTTRVADFDELALLSHDYDPDNPTDETAAAVLALAVHLQSLLGTPLIKAVAIAQGKKITITPDGDGYRADLAE